MRHSIAALTLAFVPGMIAVADKPAERISRRTKTASLKPGKNVVVGRMLAPNGNPYAVRFWTAGKQENHGFMVHGDSGDYMIAYSREAEEIKNRPSLAVIYVPK